MISALTARLVTAAMLVLGSAAIAHAGDLTVSAASSLTNALQDISRAYERQHPGSRVALNFGASGALLQQAARGAPVDVLAFADQETMDAAEGHHVVARGARRDFARNALVLVVPTDGGRAFERMQDLERPAVQRIAIGNPASVPAGRYARQALEASGLWPVVSARMINTLNVRQSLDYVARGEVDAGFVFATDAAIRRDAVRVAFEVPLDTAILYPIAATTAAASPAEAERFVAFVLSPEAQAILRAHGFRQP